MYIYTQQNYRALLVLTQILSKLQNDKPVSLLIYLYLSTFY